MRKSKVAAALFSTLALAACDEEGLVGTDPCLGASTSCRAPETVEMTVDPEERSVAVDSLDLALLQPVSRSVLALQKQPSEDLLEAQGMAPVLFGGAPGALWLTRPNGERSAAELYRVGANGALTRLSDLIAPEPPAETGVPTPSSSLPVGLITNGVKGFQQPGAPGPLLHLWWMLDSGLVDQTVGLADGRDTPLFDRTTKSLTPGFVLHAKDGGSWSLEQSLQKRDADGVLVLQQSLVSSSNAISAISQQSRPQWLRQPAVVLPSGELAMAGWIREGESTYAPPAFWRFDQNGNATYHAVLTSPPRQPGHMVSTTDSRGRWILVTMESTGDLVFSRVDTDRNAITNTQRVRRAHYTWHSIVSVTHDSADNIYVLSPHGDRDREKAMLCRLPPEGVVSCVLAPELNGWSIVGGGKGELFGLHVNDDSTLAFEANGEAATSTSGDVSLLRYVFPD